jgi:hypothetical protein
LDPTFLGVVTAFMEKSSMGMGLGQSEALSLTLAAEEIFSYLCRIAPSQEELEVRCMKGGYYVSAEFIFGVGDFNMGAFNLTASVSVEDESSLGDLGLLIASRSLDYFKVEERQGRQIRLTLIKDKRYPPIGTESVPAVEPMEEFSVKAPDAAETKVFVLLAHHHYSSPFAPEFFWFPGKVVDMIHGGHYQAAVALNPKGGVGGGILWHRSGLRTVECFGPYLFNQGLKSPMSGSLIEACLHAIAKSGAVGLINRFPTEDVPEGYFEILGDLIIVDRAGSSKAVPVYFRQLEEDPGAFMWAHPDLQGFLSAQYSRLVLARQLMAVRDSGEAKARRSVIFTEFHRTRSIVTLTPIRTGMDQEENIASHLNLLRSESAKTILFEMDLGVGWQAGFTPALLKNGFVPRFILPYAGEGDVVVFQWGVPGQ